MSSFALIAKWPESQAAGLVESLLRNMHVPEILFNTYTPVLEDLWYTVVKAGSRIRPEGSHPLPGGFDEVWTADDVEDDEELAAAVAKGDLVPREVWNCADGKQRMSSIKRYVPIILVLPPLAYFLTGPPESPRAAPGTTGLMLTCCM